MLQNDKLELLTIIITNHDELSANCTASTVWLGYCTVEKVVFNLKLKS